MIKNCKNLQLKLALISTKINYFQLRDTDDDLVTRSRVLSVMIMKVQQSRIVMAYKYYHYDI